MTDLSKQFTTTQPKPLPEGVTDLRLNAYRVPSGNMYKFSGPHVYLMDPGALDQLENIFRDPRNDIKIDAPSNGGIITMIDLNLGVINTIMKDGAASVAMPSVKIRDLDASVGIGRDVQAVLAIAEHRGLTGLPAAPKAATEAMAPLLGRPEPLQ